MRTLARIFPKYNLRRKYIKLMHKTAIKTEIKTQNKVKTTNLDIVFEKRLSNEKV